MRWLVFEALFTCFAAFMILGMFFVPWMNLTEFTLASALGWQPKATWAVASFVVIMGSATLGVFCGLRAEARSS